MHASQRTYLFNLSIPQPADLDWLGNDQDDDDEAHLLAPIGNPTEEGQLVWSGSISEPKKPWTCAVDASLVDGQAQPDLMPNELSIKGRLPLIAVEAYLKEKAKVEHKLRSVFRFTPVENRGQASYDELRDELSAEDK
jgi:hypothetical protein